MSAITAAVTAAKATIDRLLSNGNASATSGLIRSEEAEKTPDGKEIRKAWHYAEPFSSPEISVKYFRNGREWIYSMENNATDSTCHSMAAPARTLREARLGALTAMAAGCTAQPEKADGGAKEELLKMMQGEDHQHGVEGALKSGLLAGRR